MISFRKKNVNVLSHWFVLIDNFRFSTHEFYREVEEALRTRDVPGLMLSEVKYHEAGMLSDKRVYLRMVRDEFAFDICAAPFGQAYFFSVRFIELPPVNLWKVLGVAVLITGLLRGAAFVFRFDAFDVDRVLAVLAGAGLLALCFVLVDRLRRDTYYRHDTRLMYHTLVSEVVKAKVDELTAAKGAKLLRSFEYNPILGELYKRGAQSAASEPVSA